MALSKYEWSATHPKITIIGIDLEAGDASMLKIEDGTRVTWWAYGRNWTGTMTGHVDPGISYVPVLLDDDSMDWLHSNGIGWVRYDLLFPILPGENSEEATWQV